MIANVTISPLPSNFIGTPQQLIEALADRMEVSFDGNSFVIGDVAPASNQGPWLKNGTQWYVWEDSGVNGAGYYPLDVSASISEQIYIGDVSGTTPDPTKYSLWLKLRGTLVLGLYYYAGTSAGWVTTPNELVTGSVTLDKLASQAVGSLITFNAAGNAVLFAPGTPGLFLQTTGTGFAWSQPPVLRGISTFITPTVLATLTPGVVPWTTINNLQNSGVPPTASALILSTYVSNCNTIATISMRANASGSTYILNSCNHQDFGSSTMQGIFPLASSSGLISIDYSVDGALVRGTVTLIGYIS